MNFIIKKILIFFRNNPYLSATIVFYGSLFLSNSNKTLLLLGVIYVIYIYKLSKDLKFATFLGFLTSLPFAKGKALNILILPLENINRFALFDIEYFFPVYIADFFLLFLVYFYLRKKIFIGQHKDSIKNHRQILLPAMSFIFFLIISLVKIFYSSFPDVILLSSVQLLRLFIVFILASSFINWRKYTSKLLDVISISVLFQSSWVILQKINHGPLNRDLEVFLPHFENGILAAENTEIIRQSGTFFEPSILGTFLLVHLSMLSFVLIRKKLTRIQQRIYLLAISMGIVAIIFTNSRAIYLLFILIALWLIRINQKYFNKTLKKIFKNKKMPLFLGSIIIGIALFTAPTLFQRIKTSPSLLASDGSLMYRLELNLYSIRLASRELLGTGLNLSPYHLATLFDGDKYVFDPAHPHNIFFQVLAETGGLGLIFFLTFIYFIFRPLLIKKVRLDEFSLGAIIFLICAQIYPIFLNHPEILTYFFVYSGIYFQKILINAKK